MAEKKEEFYTAPPKLTGWKSFSTFIWNSDTHQFLGRTGGSWAKIGLFYLVFYAFLAGFFAAMLIVFYQTLDYHQPRWQNVNGLIGKNPGLGFRPMPDEDHVESTLIWFKHGSGGNWQHWYSELEKFLKPYDTLSSSGEYFTSCSFDKLPQENKVCNFDIKLLGNACTKEESFGYERGRPCVILKLNKIYGWVPVPYNSSKDLPEKMPFDLKEYIVQREAANPLNMNMVWLSCEGEGPADRETIGNLTYTPFRGFPGYYFPYKNVPGYLSPIVAIQFQKPENGVLINIECKVWAQNIDQDRQRRLGSVHFELLMD